MSCSVPHHRGHLFSDLVLKALNKPSYWRHGAEPLVQSIQLLNQEVHILSRKEIVQHALYAELDANIEEPHVRVLRGFQEASSPPHGFFSLSEFEIALSITGMYKKTVKNDQRWESTSEKRAYKIWFAKASGQASFALACSFCILFTICIMWVSRFIASANAFFFSWLSFTAMQ